MAEWLRRQIRIARLSVSLWERRFKSCWCRFDLHYLFNARSLDAFNKKADISSFPLTTIINDNANKGETDDRTALNGVP